MIERLQTQTKISEGWYLRLILLIGQSLWLGVSLALLVITANALFLTDFGSKALPYVYITVAIAGSLVSYGLTTLQKRWTLPRIIILTLVMLAIFFFLCWLGVTAVKFRWASFALIVSFSLVIQTGFVFLGGQAGRLLDVRQIKRLFPQVVAGFVVGFLLGALFVPFLVELLGRTENVILALVVSTLIWLVFVVLTYRRYRAELSQMFTSSVTKTSLTLPQLLKKRFVILIFAYQMLAAIVNQLSDFIMLTQVGVRFHTSEAIAQFYCRFTVILNGTDLLFATIIAGYFLSRLGLGIGLLANPLIMVGMFLMMVVAGPIAGLSSAIFFTIVVVTRVINITASDGTTRTSTNAAYQALPAQERGLVQTGVEGIGVPIALGLVGIVLLGFNLFPGLTLIPIVALTLLAAILWCLSAILVYRHYKDSLVMMMKRRGLREAALTLEDQGTMQAVQAFVKSDQVSQVRLALDFLENNAYTGLNEVLVQLTTHSNPEIRAEALERIENHPFSEALPSISRQIKDEADPQVKGILLRTFCAIKEDQAIEETRGYLADPQPAVRLGAIVGLLRYGGISGVLAAGQSLMDLASSAQPAERQLAAEAIGEVNDEGFFQPLASLLKDSDPTVVHSALLSAGKIRHPRLLDPIIANLSSLPNRSAAMAALVAYGEGILLVLKDAFSENPGYTQDQILRLLRVAGQVKGESVIALLKQQIGQANHQIRHQVLETLSQCEYHASPDDLPAMTQAVEREMEQGLQILLAVQVLETSEAAAGLIRALEDELALLRHRIFLLVSFQYNPESILPVEKRLAQAKEAGSGLAFEILEVSLAASQKSLLFPLLDPNLNPSQRIQRLSQHFNLKGQSLEELLKEMIQDPSSFWQSTWLRACAIYAASRLGIQSCREAINSYRADSDQLLRETANWALQSP